MKTTLTHIANARRHRKVAGLSLIEVLFALAVMLIGLTAIAAIFPLAAHTQSRAFDEIVAEHVAKNSEAIVRTRKISIGAISDPAYNSRIWEENILGNTPLKDHGNWGDVGGQLFQVSHDLMFWNPDGTGSYRDIPARERFHLEDRSFPSAIADPTQRQFYWVPLMRDLDVAGNVRNMNVYVFVMRSEVGVDYGTQADDTYTAQGDHGYGINRHDPPTVPKIFSQKRQNSGGWTAGRTNLDEMKDNTVTTGSWVVFQQYVGTLTPSRNSADEANTDVFSVAVSGIPEARPIEDLYMGHKGKGRMYVVPPGERIVREDGGGLVSSPGKNSKRESPLRRIHVFGGEVIRR